MTPRRRYDFDALRSAAMLAGILFHFALSFSQGTLWFVMNPSRSPEIYALQKAIHGFHMPLFFVLSGFFTAMTWQRKGINVLLANRFRRIFLPCALGTLTIIPMCLYLLQVSFQAPPPKEPPAYLLPAAPSKWHPEFGVTSLSLAIATNQKETVRRLLKDGVDPNTPNEDGSLPLHMATFLGRSEIFHQLLDAGADMTNANLQVAPLPELASQNFTLAHLMSKWFNVPFDRQEWQAGIKEIKREIGITGGTQKAWWNFLRHFPFFIHLWFLWYLFLMALLLYGCTLFCKREWPLSPLKKLPILNLSRFAWIIPMTIILQWPAQDLPLSPMFGPKLSASILPDPFTFFYYVLFFLFGMLYFDTRDDKGQLGKNWPLTLMIALFIVYPLELELTSNFFGFLNLSAGKYLHHFFTCTLEALYSWLMVFSCMGLARALVKKENPTIRYISDSSYWLYVAHLPLVIAAQMWIVHWPFPLWASFFLGSAGVIGILLLTYQLFVRYTWIGTLLNGPRTKESK